MSWRFPRAGGWSFPSPQLAGWQPKARWRYLPTAAPGSGPCGSRMAIPLRLAWCFPAAILAGSGSPRCWQMKPAGHRRCSSQRTEACAWRTSRPSSGWLQYTFSAQPGSQSERVLQSIRLDSPVLVAVDGSGTATILYHQTAPTRTLNLVVWGDDGWQATFDVPSLGTCEAMALDSAGYPSSPGLRLAG